MEFADKVVIITGSSRGIGRATALAFVKAGASVTIHGQNAEKLNETKELLKQAGAKENQICAVLGPIEEEATAEELVGKTVEAFGKIDILVNNAGIGRKPGVEDPHSLETFDYLFAVNVRSIVQLTTLATLHLAKTKGCVINISSIASSMPFIKNPYYGMTKAALDHYTKDIANMLGQKHGIRVNSVNPGPIESEFGSRWEVPGQNEDEYAKQLRERFMARLISGRFGSCEEAAEVIKFLASPRASYIWGATIVVDGGAIPFTPF